MRTLERIKLHHYEGINESEQKGMKGGGDGMGLVWSDEFGCYMLPEVYVYGDKPKPDQGMYDCPACLNYSELSGGATGAGKPLGDAINTIAHLCGLGDHK